MAEQTEAPATTQPTTTTAATTTTATRGPAPGPSSKAKAAKKVQQKPVAKKRKFVKDGIFYAEINDYFKRELSENGYAGCEVRVTPTRTEIFIRATQSNLVVGDSGRRIRELTALIQKKFKFPKKGVILFCEKVRNQGLSALAQAEAVKYRLLQGLSVRRAAYSVLKFIMDRGADGCEITISGKLRGQRAKSMKFRDGYMIHAGDAVNYYIDKAIKHVHLRQGVIGIRVKIMLPHLDTNREGQSIVIVPRELPDKVTVIEPKSLTDDVKKEEQDQHQQQSGQIPHEFLQDTQPHVDTLPMGQNIPQQPQVMMQHSHQMQQNAGLNTDQNFQQSNLQNVDTNYDYNQQQQQQPYDQYNDQQYNQQHQYSGQYNTNQQGTNQFYQSNQNF